ncbi:MAG: energy-coupling factor ABC transporter permease [Sedimentisphaerales bacterium]|nr:energy-coupling factor ABC transporter permease [Sedimentisphaerales bacterium]
MANELLSVPIATGTLALAGGGLVFICRQAQRFITPSRLAMMGVMGAFVFAAQMVNFPLPLLPGTSGHLVGAVLLSIILGPWLGSIVMASVVVLQCLIFQDGGLLALGCNLINMALVPCFAGYGIYRWILGDHPTRVRMYVAGVTACVVALEIGAILVPIQAAMSGVLLVPFHTFLGTMVGVHLIIGFIEGLVTTAVLAYLRQVRPDVIADCPTGQPRWSMAMVYVSLLVLTLAIGTGLALLASEKPDGLEWSYADRPDQPEFEPIIVNENPTIASVDALHARMAPLPDYTIRSDSAAAGWTSFAAVIGSGLTMALIWLVGWAIRRKEPVIDASCTG